MSSLKRENWIDVCRGVGILLVMLGHSGTPPRLNKIIYSFHMPLFFTLSGYLFRLDGNKNIKQDVYKNLKRYVIPYFCYFFINLMIQMVRLWICGEMHLSQRFFTYMLGGGIIPEELCFGCRIVALCGI